MFKLVQSGCRGEHHTWGWIHHNTGWHWVWRQGIELREYSTIQTVLIYVYWWPTWAVHYTVHYERTLLESFMDIQWTTQWAWWVQTTESTCTRLFKNVPGLIICSFNPMLSLAVMWLATCLSLSYLNPLRWHLGPHCLQGAHIPRKCQK